MEIIAEIIIIIGSTLIGFLAGVKSEIRKCHKLQAESRINTHKVYQLNNSRAIYDFPFLSLEVTCGKELGLND